MYRFLALFCLVAAPLPAQDRAGVFDYYVLSLSWSANWCTLEGDARASEQCAQDSGFGWVLHGLWPQYESGYPVSCATSQRPPTRAQTAAMADIMGTSGLAWHQWRKHGVCTGLSSQDYYSLSRLAFGKVTQPAILGRLTREVTLPASLIQEAFIDANPVLADDQITITCTSGYIQEARICLNRDLEFRTCGSDLIRDCTMSNARFTPAR